MSKASSETDALGRVVQPHQQRQQRALARPARPDDGDELAARNREGQRVEIPFGSGIAESDVVEADLAERRRQRLGAAVADARGARQQFVDAAHAAGRLHQRRQELRHGGHRVAEAEEERLERGERADGELAPRHHVRADGQERDLQQHDPHIPRSLHQAREEADAAHPLAKVLHARLERRAGDPGEPEGLDDHLRVDGLLQQPEDPAVLGLPAVAFRGHARREDARPQGGHRPDEQRHERQPPVEHEEQHRAQHGIERRQHRPRHGAHRRGFDGGEIRREAREDVAGRVSQSRSPSRAAGDGRTSSGAGRPAGSRSAGRRARREGRRATTTTTAPSARPPISSEQKAMVAAQQADVHEIAERERQPRVVGDLEEDADQNGHAQPQMRPEEMQDAASRQHPSDEAGQLDWTPARQPASAPRR